MRSAGIFATRSRCAMLRNCSPSAVWTRITQRSGVGFNDTVPNWKCDCAVILSRPTNPGGLITYSRVQGRWCYLYRAIDSTGATIDFLLSALRDAAAAQRLFRKALSDPSHPQPRVINTDKASRYGSAIAAVKAEGTLRRRCRHRPVQYLNNILEQDHRAIKRRVKAKQSFREFRAAGRTLAGYEAIHMIRKGQARWVSSDAVRQQNRFIDQLFDLAA